MPWRDLNTSSNFFTNKPAPKSINGKRIECRLPEIMENQSYKDKTI
jgi:hypothetical protein